MKLVSKTGLRNLIAVGGFLVLSTAYVVHDGHTNSSGVTGSTEKPIQGGSSPGCNCHTTDASAATEVTITTTATSFEPGQTYRFKVSVTNSGMEAAGVNIAKYLAGQDATTSSKLTVIAGQGLRSAGATQLTHSTPKALTEGSTSWEFDYTAPPASKPSDTLYATANAVNGNGGADPDDQWAHAAKFVINTVSNSVSPRTDIAEAFAIGPNPARDMAKLFFMMKKPADLRIAIVDASGREVYVQQKQDLSFGRGEVMLDLTNLSAGDYLVNVTSGGSFLYTGKISHSK
jgi:hypothetical protein